MAKETAKKNWRRNAARMYVFSVITLIVNIVYVFRIMYRNGGLPGFRDLLAIIFWSGQEYAALQSLKQIALPTLNSHGELVDCIDVSNPQELGYYSFVQDILWVCWVVQTLCNVHGAFIVFYLPVPATIIYKVWNTFLRPLLALRFGIGNSSCDSNDENDDSNDNGSASSGHAPRNRQERRREELRQRKSQRKSTVSISNNKNDFHD